VDEIIRTEVTRRIGASPDWLRVLDDPIVEPAPEAVLPEL
jgi:hypothetical protein